MPDFRISGRQTGKTTFLRNEAVKAARAGEYVQMFVPTAQQAAVWKPPSGLQGRIEIIPASRFEPYPRGRNPSARRFVDDAEIFLDIMMHGYDIAVANGTLFTQAKEYGA